MLSFLTRFKNLNVSISTKDLKLLPVPTIVTWRDHIRYRKFLRVKTGQSDLCNKMAEYVKKRGKVIVINPEKDKTMVQVIVLYL